MNRTCACDGKTGDNFQYCRHCKNWYCPYHISINHHDCNPSVYKTKNTVNQNDKQPSLTTKIYKSKNNKKKKYISKPVPIWPVYIVWISFVIAGLIFDWNSKILVYSLVPAILISAVVYWENVNKFGKDYLKKKN